MWIASPEQLRYLAAAVLLLCPAAPRRFASPPELARLRDKLHAAAVGRQSLVILLR
jgi:hypothetical protein